jgi:hypothetical protein
MPQPRGTPAVSAGSHAADTLSRLLAVDWRVEASFDHARSRARLMREYLRRASLWAEVLDATEAWPFFDIAGHLAPEVDTPEEFASQLEALISTGIGWPSVMDTCRNVLRWAAVLDAGVPIPGDLADPFDPMLWLFERGGGWTTEGGFIELGGASVRRRTWRDHLSTEPTVTLTQSALDALDQAYLRKIGRQSQ